MESGVGEMTPLFIYKKGSSYLVRDLGDKVTKAIQRQEGLKPPEDYMLVSSIDAPAWLQCYLNYEAKDRRRMMKELEGNK